MKITLNQKTIDVADNSSLYDILTNRSLLRPGIAVAVNNKVIVRADWQDFIVPADAKITVISAVCGG